MNEAEIQSENVSYLRQFLVVVEMDLISVLWVIFYRVLLKIIFCLEDDRIRLEFW